MPPFGMQKAMFRTANKSGIQRRRIWYGEVTATLAMVSIEHTELSDGLALLCALLG